MKFSYALISMACLPSVLIEASKNAAHDTATPERAIPPMGPMKDLENQMPKYQDPYEKVLEDTVKLEIIIPPPEAEIEEQKADNGPDKDDYCGRCLTVICPRAFYDLLRKCWGEANKVMCCPFVAIAYGCCFGCMKICDAGSEDPLIDFNVPENAFRAWLDNTKKCVISNCWQKLVEASVKCADGTFHYKRSRLRTCGPDAYRKVKGICQKGLRKSISDGLDFKPGYRWGCGRDQKNDCSKLRALCQCLTKPFIDTAKYFLCGCAEYVPDVLEVADVVVGVAEVAGVAQAI